MEEICKLNENCKKEKCIINTEEYCDKYIRNIMLNEI